MQKLGLEDLKNIINNPNEIEEVEVTNVFVGSPQIIREPKLDKFGRAYSTGKRKCSVARVWLKPGSGKIVVNDKNHSEYFGRSVLQMVVEQPMKFANRNNQYDVCCTVKGGGLSGQAGAVRHGISCALTYFEPELRSVLKQGKFLTRDSREVERKKSGRPKARKRFQFSKR